MRRSQEAIANRELKDHLFESHIKGNVLWPQEAFGIDIFVLDSFLENSNDWNQIEFSLFTQQQIERLGKLMDHVHLKSNIRHKYDRKNRLVGDQDVPRLRLETLWSEEKFELRTMMVNFIKLIAMPPELKDNLDQLSDFNKVKFFLMSQEYKTYADEIRKLVSDARKTLISPEGISISKSYKAALTAGDGDKANEERRKMIELICQSVKRDNPNTDDRVINVLTMNNIPD